MEIVKSRQRSDYEVIVRLLCQQSKKAKVLDVGCGNGELLHTLVTHHGIDGRGLEINQTLVNEAVAKGLAVIQADANKDLPDYAQCIFDCVILSQTIQATLEPKTLLEKLVKIGQCVIVSFPNFGYWKLAFSLIFKGSMPVSQTLPFAWYETPNIHLCTIKDFFKLCNQSHIEVIEAYSINARGQPKTITKRFGFFTHVRSLFAKEAVFLLRKKR